MSEPDQELYVGGFEGTDQVDPSESLTGDNTDDPLDAGYSPPDREPKATRFGTTADEQVAGETLDQRLAQEEPDIKPDDRPVDEFEGTTVESDERAGRLIAPDEGAHVDKEMDAVAFDAGPAGYAASAEEAAVHIIEER
jgi:Family of unknown function (DUF5709)